MSRNWRVASVALAVTAVAALVIPMSVNAQKVANPGTFSLQSTGGSLSVGGLGIDLTPQPLPQCSDGIDNDGTGGVDLADSGCAAGPNGEPASSDDSELAPGYQPKVNVSITGSVNKAGVVSIPASGVVFPPAYIGINFNGLWIVKAEVIATETATGTLDPLTGATVLDVRARIKLSGNVGNQLASSCSIGTASNPIHMNLITGRKVNSSGSAITGMAYNPISGTAMLVDNSFSVPGASGCTAGIFNLNSTINGEVGIPSAAGRNIAVVGGRTTPVLGRAINPVITSSPGLTGAQAPFSVTFGAANSTVVAGPATYSWSFSDGTTATGEYVEKTFGAGAQSATLTVTDAEGDSLSTTTNFTVGGTTGSSTTAAPTTAAPTTAAPTTAAPTTAAPTTAAPTTAAPTTAAPTTAAPTTAAPTTAAPTTAAPTTAAPTTAAPTTAAPTTAAPTTAAPTTAAPTTAAPTTVPSSDDTVSVQVSGAVNYTNSGSGNGGLTVRRDGQGVTSVKGSLDIAGTAGGSANISVSATRAWILPLWTGEVSIRDQAAGVSVKAPVFGQVSGSGATATASSNWFLPGTFPNLFRPYSIRWTVTDAG